MRFSRLAAWGAAGTLILGLAVMTAVGQTPQPPIDVPLTTARIPLSVEGAAKVLERVPARSIPLIPQTLIRPFGGGTIREVRIRALHDGKMLYLLLAWNDATVDGSPQRLTTFTDAVALQFPVQSGTLPNPFMGEKDRPVNIWQWKASWQEELLQARTLRKAYPAMSVDYYYDVQFLKDETARRTFNAGAASGNLLSQPRRTSAVEDLVAWGFGTLTTQPRQDVIGFGAHRGGRWTVLLARPLRTDDPADVQFRPGATTHVNFAVWDGGNKDRNGQKNVTLMWWPLRLRSGL